ncbi:hypothetical protein SMC26_03675 [Actinomadura fulvescens]|uniref:Uncharacterized protein n=1 Tax=Actinomadura fulvescens TaxID=46160 RepID=A0ABP6C9B0_9ACTN
MANGIVLPPCLAVQGREEPADRGVHEIGELPGVPTGADLTSALPGLDRRRQRVEPPLQIPPQHGDDSRIVRAQLDGRVDHEAADRIVRVRAAFTATLAGA